jgi:DNA polymerase III epsilon subunit-like protein
MRYPKNYTVIDTETTGLDVKKDMAIEICAVKVTKDMPDETKTWLIRPSFALDPFIINLTGITDAELEANGMDEKACLSEFAEFIDGDVLVGHYLSKYDIPLLRHRMRFHEISLRDTANRWVDTAALYKARALNIEQAWDEDTMEFSTRVLETMSHEKFNLGLAFRTLTGADPVDAHRALGDCLMVKEVYKKLVYG